MLLHLMALLLLVLAAVPASRAEERILSWHSDIVVEKSGDLVVTETITVRAEGDRIKRGIYRDLPVLREGEGGLRTTKRFTILSVKRDGKRENYKRERIENGLRIRIGNKDRNLLKGGSTPTRLPIGPGGSSTSRRAGSPFTGTSMARSGNSLLTR